MGIRLAQLKKIINGQFGMPCFPNDEVEARMVGKMLEIRILCRRVLVNEDGKLIRADNVPFQFTEVSHHAG